MEPSPFSLFPLLSLPPHCTTQLHCWATKNVFGVDYVWSCFPNHLAYSLHVHYCIAPLWSVLALRHQYFSEQKWRYGFEPVNEVPVWHHIVPLPALLLAQCHQFIMFTITILTIHDSFTVSLQTENTSVPQILPITGGW